MSRHNKIVKKKSGKDELIGDPAAASIHWVEAHGWKITAIAVVLFVVALVGISAAYYGKVTFNSAQSKLYDAAVKEQKAEAGAGKMKDAVDEYESMIASGGKSGAIIQARMSVARLYVDGGEPAKAAEHFLLAAKAAGEDTLVGELCQVGLAQAWAKQGKVAEAEAKLNGLAAGAKYYPKAEILIDLAYIQAAAGNNKEAGKTLAKIKSGDGGLVVPIPVEDTIGRMERGEITEGLKDLSKAMAAAARDKEIKTAERAKAPVQPAADAPKPVAPGAVHGAGETRPAN